MTYLVRGLDLDGYRHPGHLIFPLVLEPWRRFDLFPDLRDALPVHLRSVLQAIQRILQFAYKLVSQLGLTCSHARGLKIRDRTDLVAFGFAGDLNEIPPRALLLFEFLLRDGCLLLQRKSVVDETRKPVAFDHTNHVEVEIPTVP